MRAILHLRPRRSQLGFVNFETCMTFGCRRAKCISHTSYGDSEQWPRHCGEHADAVKRRSQTLSGLTSGTTLWLKKALGSKVSALSLSMKRNLRQKCSEWKEEASHLRRRDDLFLPNPVSQSDFWDSLSVMPIEGLDLQATPGLASNAPPAPASASNNSTPTLGAPSSPNTGMEPTPIIEWQNPFLSPASLIPLNTVGSAIMARRRLHQIVVVCSSIIQGFFETFPFTLCT